MKQYLATTYGCTRGAQSAYRVWLIDDEDDRYWLRQVTPEDLHSIDAALLAERLNRDEEARVAAEQVIA